MNSKDLLEHFNRESDNIIASVFEIVEIESPSFDVDGSRSVVSWIESRAKECIRNVSAERITEPEIGEHLIIKLFEGMSEKKPILILGHTDTVHPVGSKSQNPTRVENGRLYGCGTFDMKANIALLLEVLRAFETFELKPKRPINILLACDEEVGSETGRKHVERMAGECEFCLVFEPSAAGKVKTGRKGTGGYTLKALGIPSHAGLEPKRGASAILEISKQIEKLHALTDFDIGTTVTVGLIKGGTATNVVPAEAECSIDVRFETLREAGRIEKELNSMKPFDKRISLVLSGGINRPPMERTPAVVKLFESARSIAESFDYELGEEQVGGASDGNFVGAMGIPLLDGLGITGDGAHTLDEYVLVEDIPKRATLLAKMLLED